MDSTRHLLWKRLHSTFRRGLNTLSRSISSSARRPQELLRNDSVAMSARLIGGTSGASAGSKTENLSIKTSQQVYIRWYGSSKPKERSIHEPIAFSPSYGAASKNVSTRANAYVFKRLHLRLDGNRRPSTPSVPIPAMRATETELTWHTRPTLFPTEPQKQKSRLPSVHVISPKRVLSIVNRIMSNARFARPVFVSWSQVVGDNKPKEFRLYPRRPRGRQTSSPRPWCSTYILLLRYVRLLRAHRGPQSGRRASVRPYNQRCAVRVMYAKNATRGQWKAHGRYIARESASQGPAAEAGFDATERGINIVARLDQWQSAGYERLWTLILSPEFGDKIDLIRLTRDLTKRMARDLDTRLEWVAVSHFNTDNPHVHIALRGVRVDGRPLRLERDYVKHGIRIIAEDLCTRRLGYRTQLDVAQTQRHDVSQQRFTSLDRAITQDNPADGQSSHFLVSRNPAQPRNQYVIARLRTLESMGLAEAAGADQWLVRQDLETALRAMQRLGGRQKVLAAHGVPVSDTRLPLAMFDLRKCTTLEGRILVHGEDEGSGRSFMMLEGTDAKVHCIYHTPQMAEARGRGGLRVNGFVRLRKLFQNGRPLLEIDELGHSK